jgi:ABC-type lipoprotein release transport system permease subunit
VNWQDLLRTALFGLFQHKLRTLLTLCGVSLGSLLLFTSLSGGLGVIRTVNERLGVGERLMEIAVSSGFLMDDVTADEARQAGFTQEMSDERRIRLARASGIGGRKNVPLNLESAKKLAEMDHVAGIWPVVNFRAAMYVDSQSRWTVTQVKGVQPNRSLKDYIIAGGEFSGESANEIILGELYLYQLGIQSDEEIASIVGTTVRFVPGNKTLTQKASQLLATQKKPLRKLPAEAQKKADETSAKLKREIQAEVDKLNYDPEDFTVVGVVRTPSLEEVRFHPWLNSLSRNALMTHAPASEIWRKIHPPTRQINAVIRADEAENVMRLETEISDLGFRTQSMSKLALQIRSAVLLITLIITAIAAAALLISGVGITNTMVMNVLERRREIAIMKSIGAQDIDVRRMFLLEGMLIGILGGILGLVLGRVLSGMTSQYIGQLLEWKLKEPFGDQIFAYPWWLIILTPCIAAAVTTVASLLPARQAARLDPVATLRAL